MAVRRRPNIGATNERLADARPSETLMIGPDQADWARRHVTGLDVVGCGRAAHVVQEDQPAAIAAAVSSWLDRHALRTPATAMAS